MEANLEGRVALITGAGRGIGGAIARQLADRGVKVAVASRRGENPGVDGALARETDVRDYASVKAMVDATVDEFGQLDILVGNAGILGPLSPLGHVTADAWDDVMAINLTANWRLIRTLDPLLRRSDAGRAIFVSSGAAVSRPAYWGPYAVSKAALEALVVTYANEVENTSVRVNLVNPGPTRTAMRAKAFPGENPLSLKVPEDVTPTFVRLASPDCTDNGRAFDLKTGEVR